MKTIKRVLVMALMLLLFVGCGGGSQKIGLGNVSTVSEDENIVNFVTTFAGVYVNKGKIEWVAFDESQQNDVTISNVGVTTFADKKTKRDLGDDYGMKSSSALGKEWHEQIHELEKLLIGKKIDEFDSESLKEDLKSSVSINVDQELKALEKALESLKEFKGSVVELGLGNHIMVSGMDAQSNNPGVSEAVTEMAVVAFDSEHSVLAAVLDNAQLNVNYNAQGVITLPTEELLTKKEKGENYGMKDISLQQSGIGKEWFEQNENIENYVVGKLIEEITDLPDKAMEDDDVRSQATIYIGGMKSAIISASENTQSLK